MEVGKNGKIIFNESEVSKLLIGTLSGLSSKDIATTLRVSPDTIRRNQKANKDILDLFILNKTKDKLRIRDTSKELHINGDLCFRDIDVTGNEDDGILYVNSLYECDGDLGEYDFEPNDIGTLKQFIVGKVYSRDGHKITADGELKTSLKYNINLGERYYTKPTRKKPTKVEVEKSEEVEVEIKKDEIVPPVWSASSKFISITDGRNVYNADSSHERFKDALTCLVNDDIMGAIELINIERGIKEFARGNINIENEQLFYKGYEIKSGLTDRIINSMLNGEEFEFYLPFLENLMLNPSKKAIERLFDFLVANDIEITDDGYILAWKKITKDFKDIYTNTYDNSIGTTVTMPRILVNDDDKVTCSNGLHVCSKSYLNHFGGSDSDIVVKVKLHPKDVVSIPVDYNNAKMRVCEYTVLEVVDI